jgi:hypothetical protein
MTAEVMPRARSTPLPKPRALTAGPHRYLCAQDGYGGESPDATLALQLSVVKLANAGDVVLMPLVSTWRYFDYNSVGGCVCPACDALPQLCSCSTHFNTNTVCDGGKWKCMAGTRGR